MTSVLVPVYNGAHVLERTVPAVLALDGIDEWVWVDDGSTDGTADLLHRLIGAEARARVVRHAQNRGRGAARNSAVAAASGQTLVFFDADARPSATAAARLVSALEQQGAVAATSRVTTVLERPEDPYQRYLAEYPRGAPSGKRGEPVPWRFFLTCACAVRRDAFEAAGGFDASIAYGEDFALACRLRQRAPAGLRLAETTVELADAATFPQALANVAAFGHAFPTIEAICPEARSMSGVGPVWLGRPGQVLSRLAPLVLRLVRLLADRPVLLPPPVVRYVLAVTFLSAYHGARPDPS